MHGGLCDFLVRSVVAGAFVALTAVAQKGPVRISGRVTATTGAAVSDACVTLKVAGSKDTVAALRTNHNGEFTFAGIAPDAYDLSVVDGADPPFSLYGYKPRYQTVKADKGDVAVPTIVLDVDPNGPDYEYDGPNPRIEPGNYESWGRLLEVHNRCTVDLDAGRQACPGTTNAGSRNSRDDDIRVEADGQKLFIAPINGAGLAVADTHAPHDDICQSARYSRSRIRIDQWPAGALLCVGTNKGRRGTLFVSFTHEVCVPGDLYIAYWILKR